MSEAAQTPSSCEVVRVWPPADPAAFADGLSRLASSVAIVACNTPEGPRGLRVTSVTSVSTTPPRLLVCVNKAATGHGALIKTDAVSIALLGADQAADADAFGEPGRAGFDPARWRLDLATPPQLNDALASFTGPVRCRIDAGAATLFVIDVSTAGSRQGAPLVQLADALRTLC
jgi:flavin reductase (DIM6/NTAB) family NADH-FMN oxidoreductase RutF